MSVPKPGPSICYCSATITTDDPSRKKMPVETKVEKLPCHLVIQYFRDLAKYEQKPENTRHRISNFMVECGAKTVSSTEASSSAGAVELMEMFQRSALFEEKISS